MNSYQFENILILIFEKTIEINVHNYLSLNQRFNEKEIIYKNLILITSKIFLL